MVSAEKLEKWKRKLEAISQAIEYEERGIPYIILLNGHEYKPEDIYFDADGNYEIRIGPHVCFLNLYENGFGWCAYNSEDKAQASTYASRELGKYLRTIRVEATI